MSDSTTSFKHLPSRGMWGKIFKDYRDVNRYIFLDDCYFGRGGFEGKVLKTKQEDPDPYSYININPTENFYPVRVMNAIYINFFKKFVDAKYKPVFSIQNNNTFVETDSDTPVNLEDHPYHNFVKNITGSGMIDKNKFYQNVLRRAYIDDVAFVVMDKRADDIQPYCYMQKAITVSDYELDYYGNLNMIAFLINYNHEKKEYSRRVFRIDSFDIEISKDNMKTWSVVESKPNNLGIIPVYPLFTHMPEEIDKLMDEPSNYDLGALMVWLYNKGANLDWMIEKQVHALLILNGEVESVGDAFSNAIVIPEGTNKLFDPKYISPDPGLAEPHMKRIDQVIAHMFDLMAESGVTASTGEIKVESGVAKSYTFNATNTQLKFTVNLCKELDEWIYKTYRIFMNEESANYVVYTEYAKEFSPKTTLSTDQLIALSDFMKENGLIENQKDILFKIINTINPNASKDEIEIIREEVEGLINQIE